MIAADHFGSQQIEQRIADVEQMWRHLMEIAALRKQRLLEAVDYHQFFADADDTEQWMLDTLKIVTSPEVGHDEYSADRLLRKHRGVDEYLTAHASAISGLKEQVQALGDDDRTAPEVSQRISDVQSRYNDIEQMSQVRSDRLNEAKRYFQLLNDADIIDEWIRDKTTMLNNLEPSNDDIEELEVVKHRFKTFESDLERAANNVSRFNTDADELIKSEHANSAEILQRQRVLNDNWNDLLTKSNEKRRKLDELNVYLTFKIEAVETIRWIEEKMRSIDDGGDVGGEKDDLAALLSRQRRLSFVERDQLAIDSRIESLEDAAAEIARKRPDEAALIRSQIVRVAEAKAGLNSAIYAQEAKLEEAGDLQRFLRDLDAFQAWLTRTQIHIASAELPSSPTDADNLIILHNQTKDEIRRFEPEYHRLMDKGREITSDQSDSQYVLLDQRLQALATGWDELSKMCDKRSEDLNDAAQYEDFAQDARQAERILKREEQYLESIVPPNSLEEADKAWKRHELFLATKPANDDKVSDGLKFESKLNPLLPSYAKFSPTRKNSAPKETAKATKSAPKRAQSLNARNSSPNSPCSKAIASTICAGCNPSSDNAMKCRNSFETKLIRDKNCSFLEPDSAPVSTGGRGVFFFTICLICYMY